MTNELAWYVALQQKKYPEAAALLEKQLESGQIPRPTCLREPRR
jgi:hypothetical protein